MISLLKSTRTLLIEPQLWRAMVDELPAKMSAVKAEDEDGDLRDCYGDKLPEPFAIGKTLVIPIRGIIGKGLPEIASRYGFARVEDLEDEIFEAANDTNYERVILDIDSPGGMAQGVPELADAVAALNEAKETIGFSSGNMCSAAYWLAAGCSKIVTTRSACVGSIGCYSAIPDMTSMWEQMGVVWQMFKSGKYKGAGAQGTALTDDQKANIQADIDGIAAQFKSHVMKYRPMIPTSAMEGQSFMGQIAVDLALVDDVVTGLKTLI